MYTRYIPLRAYIHNMQRNCGQESTLVLILSHFISVIFLLYYITSSFSYFICALFYGSHYGMDCACYKQQSTRISLECSQTYWNNLVAYIHARSKVDTIYLCVQVRNGWETLISERTARLGAHKLVRQYNLYLITHSLVLCGRLHPAKCNLAIRVQTDYLCK